MDDPSFADRKRMSEVCFQFGIQTKVSGMSPSQLIMLPRPHQSNLPQRMMPHEKNIFARAFPQTRVSTGLPPSPYTQSSDTTAENVVHPRVLLGNRLIITSLAPFTLVPKATFISLLLH